MTVQTARLSTRALIDLDFSIELTGFDIAVVDFLLDGEAEAKAPDCNIDDDIPPVPALGAAITRPGDLWQLDRRSRLWHGQGAAPAVLRQVHGRHPGARTDALEAQEGGETGERDAWLTCGRRLPHGFAWAGQGALLCRASVCV